MRRSVGLLTLSILLFTAGGCSTAAPDGVTASATAAVTRSTATQVSPSAASDCQTSARMRISATVPATRAVAGRLATNMDSSLVAGSSYPTLWAVRGASPDSTLRLVATRLATTDAPLAFVGKPYAYDNESGLLDWGPTYYVSFSPLLVGCWAVSIEGGDSADTIVVLVTRGLKP